MAALRRRDRRPRHRGRRRRPPPAALDPRCAEGDMLQIGASRIGDRRARPYRRPYRLSLPTAGKLVFTADSLMAVGCGRLFEGTPAQMWHSLSKLAALPPETLICSGHEYTASNVRFALTLEPDNPALISRISRHQRRARAKGAPPFPRCFPKNWRPTPFCAPTCPR